jgi:hypothetical protein
VRTRTHCSSTCSFASAPRPLPRDRAPQAVPASSSTLAASVSSRRCAAITPYVLAPTPPQTYRARSKSTQTSTLRAARTTCRRSSVSPPLSNGHHADHLASPMPKRRAWTYYARRRHRQSCHMGASRSWGPTRRRQSSTQLHEKVFLVYHSCAVAVGVWRAGRCCVDVNLSCCTIAFAGAFKFNIQASCIMPNCEGHVRVIASTGR